MGSTPLHPSPPIIASRRLGFPHPPATSPVTYDRYSFLVHGTRTFLTSGEFHYWRLPSPSLWPLLFDRMRAAGMNAVSIYFNWAYHSAACGSYDFSGIRDVERALRDAEAAGLYVIARPGPCIYGETHGMGFPGWLLGTHARLRSLDPAYLAAVRQWYDQILPILARHQLDRGGTVIMVQLDNELVNGDPGYVAALYAMAREHDIVVPLTHNAVYFGDYATTVDVATKDSYPAGFDVRRPWTMARIARDMDRVEHTYRITARQQHVPICYAEFQGGSFDNYGGAGYDACYDWLGTSFVDAAYKSLLSEGVTAVNTYMFYGGTSWGYLPDGLVFTSYDYGAPIRESLRLGPRYDATKRVMFFAGAVGAELCATVRAEERVQSSNPAILHRVRANPESGALFIWLRNMEDSLEAETSLTLALGEAAFAVPGEGNLLLKPRGTKVLVANYRTAWGRLTYSTAELLARERQGEQETWVLWGDRGEVCETRLAVDGDVTVRASDGVHVTQCAGAVVFTFTPEEQLQTVRLRTGAHNVQFLLADRQAAAEFWRIPHGDGTLLAHFGGFLGSPSSAGVIRLESAASQRLTMYGGRPPLRGRLDDHSVCFHLDGEAGSTWLDIDKSRISGSLKLPELTTWWYRAEPSEAVVAYDDSDWAAVDQFRSLDPREHDFAFGFVWYRGRFTATGRERAVRVLAADSYTVWLNGRFVGSGDDGTEGVFSLSHALQQGADCVVAVLTQSLGHREMGLKLLEFLPSPETRRSLFRVEAAEQPDPDVFAFDRAWSLLADGSFAQTRRWGTRESGAVARIRFRGPLFRVHGLRGLAREADDAFMDGQGGTWGIARGRAELFVDGRKAAEVDASEPSWIAPEGDTAHGVLFDLHGWDNAEHEAEIVVHSGGRPNAADQGPYFVISAVEFGELPEPAVPVTIAWKLIGADGAARREGPAPANSSGLFGERHGWYAASAVGGASDWAKTALPHQFAGIGEWIGWYRTEFDLDQPADVYAPIGLVMDCVANGGDKALLFLNGYLLGHYWPDRGPQLRFFLPSGILRNGPNQVAIAVWRRNPEHGRLGPVRLEHYGAVSVSSLVLDHNPTFEPLTQEQQAASPA